MVEEDNNSQRCAYCGSTDFDYGSLTSGSAIALGAYTGIDIFYRSSIKDQIMVSVSCCTCLNCGHIKIFLDPNQIKLQKEHYNEKK